MKISDSSQYNYQLNPLKGRYAIPAPRTQRSQEASINQSQSTTEQHSRATPAQSLSPRSKPAYVSPVKATHQNHSENIRGSFAGAHQSSTRVQKAIDAYSNHTSELDKVAYRQLMGIDVYA